MSTAALLPAQPGKKDASVSGVFDLGSGREPMASLDGAAWRFHAGDDARWADPAFNDARWGVLSGDKSWDEQGYPGLSGFGWYRAKLVVPKDSPPLALYIPRDGVVTNYQAFADGRPLERCSSSAIERPVIQAISVCPLGRPGSDASHTVLLAIRVWHWPHWASYRGGGLQGGLRVGGEKQIEQWAAFNTSRTAWHIAKWDLLAILYGLAGLAAVAFFLLRPREHEYLWFGVSALLFTLNAGWQTYFQFRPDPVKLQDGIGSLLETGIGLTLIAFYLCLLGGRRSWLLAIAVASQIAGSVVMVFGVNAWISVAMWNEILVVIGLPMPFWLISLVIRRALEGFPDARLLLIPALFEPLVSITGSLLWILYIVGLYRVRPAWFYDTFQWPFPFTLADLAEFIFLVAMVAILILRFNRTSTQRERLATELEAARIVQKILVPEEIPPIPGFTVHSVYKPAGEVGGDFFQILPARSGGVLIVLGDVSGKGLPAAMVVSLLVGTARTLSSYTDEPGEMLEAMNQRMLGRTDSGFATCLILRADHQGNVCAANAGHLSPYLAGREVPLDNGHPLGLDATAAYAETAFHLDEDRQLTLVTDGVLEARNAKGELLGFERLLDLSAQPAEEIAAAAQRFGQNDDITVLALMRLQSRVPVATIGPSSGLAVG